MAKKITIIDLNNFSYYPTLSIGYLISFLRKSDFEVTLLSPLNNGVGARKREKIETKMDYWKALLLNSDSTIVKKMIAMAKRVPFVYNSYLKKSSIFEAIQQDLSLDTDLVLISTYFENFYTCQKLGAYLKAHNIPIILGGPGFNNKTVTKEWLNLEGIDVIVGSEVDNFLVNLVQDFFEGKDLNKFPGVFTKEVRDPDTSYIFRALNELPVPDYTDFPWEKYPMRIVPYMTGRGCGWGKCSFCTDVTYVNGRTFRTMRPEKVLNDLKALSEVNKTNLIYFSDIKLNSDLTVWNALINDLPKYVKDPKWFGTVHVDSKKENGLDRDSIFKAKAAGLTRISFGFETASQKLLNHMKKGTRIEKIEKFLHDVHDAGISLRATMFVGYPYENEEDLRETYEFLKRNSHCFDRINLSKFQLFEMAPLYDEVKQDFKETKLLNTKHTHHISMLVERGKKYNHYRNKVIKEVHKINSKPILKEAVEYDGIM